MSEPWYDANMWGWVPGTLLGVFGGLWGSLAGTLLPRGKGKGLVMGMYYVLMLCGAGLFVGAIVALCSSQPFGVWYSLLLPGVLTFIVVVPLGFVMRAAKRRAEERQMRAQELE